MEEINIKDSLKITLMQVGGGSKVVQLVLNGYLDTYNSPEFQSHIKSLIDSGTKYLMFNCNGLNYISSTGIGAFTSFLKILRQKNGGMVLFGLQNKVMEVFQLLGFTKFFKIASDFNKALVLLKEEEKEKTGNKKPIFPLIFECPYCSKKLKTSKAGKFRCAGCKNIFVVNNEGKVKKV